MRMSVTRRWTNAIVIVATCFALAVTLWTSYQQRQVAECQTDVNQAFLATLKGRASINDADRDVIRDLVKNVSEAKTQEEVDQAFTTFNVRQERLDRLRTQFKYPDYTQCS